MNPLRDEIATAVRHGYFGLYGLPDDEDFGIADAVLSHLAGTGDVTDEQIIEALAAEAPGRADLLVPAVRGLLTRQQATTTTARIAELETRVTDFQWKVGRLELDLAAALARVAELERERDELWIKCEGAMYRVSLAEDARVRLATEAFTAPDEGWDAMIDSLRARIGDLVARAEAAEAQVARVKEARVWVNEDGKGFVFSADLRAALDGEGER